MGREDRGAGPFTDDPQLVDRTGALQVAGDYLEALASAVPEAVQFVELALDTHDQSQIDRFWSVILTGSPAHVDGDSIDPGFRGPLLWFQETTPHEAPRQRFHLDVTVAPEEIGRRTKAALKEGGKVVSETPTFRVLEDRQGNRACICWTAVACSASGQLRRDSSTWRDAAFKA